MGEAAMGPRKEGGTQSKRAQRAWFWEKGRPCLPGVEHWGPFLA